MLQKRCTVRSYLETNSIRPCGEMQTTEGVSVKLRGKLGARSGKKIGQFLDLCVIFAQRQ